MTQRPDNRDGHGSGEHAERFVVPGAQERVDDPRGHDARIEEQQVRDLGSASRSCVAIIAVLLIVALAMCVFLFWAFFLQ